MYYLHMKQVCTKYIQGKHSYSSMGVDPNTSIYNGENINRLMFNKGTMVRNDYRKGDDIQL